MPWVVFTKRTNDPKLRWLEQKLADVGVTCWRRGYSFHAPILVVQEKDLTAAWAILDPVDALDDDHPMFD